jgi:four helix bundle protein
MEKSKSFKDLLIWQKSHQLVLNIYQITQNFPREELYGLTSQIRRSAASVPTNIVEGYRRKTKPDKAKFFNISLSSLDETLYHLILSHDLNYANTLLLQDNVEEIAKMLNAYYHAIIDRQGMDN